MAIFLTVILLSGGVLSGERTSGNAGVFGGPTVVSSADASGRGFTSPIAVEDVSSPLPVFVAEGRLGSNVLIYDAAAGLNDPGQPIGPDLSRREPVVYRVESGDTLTRVAAYFGVSVDTLVNANPKLKSGTLAAGSDLNILPVTGVVYQAKTGDTLESISAYFNVPEDKIMEFNQSVDFSNLDPGVSLVIPGVKNFNLADIGSNPLPNLDSYFAEPADGYNWGILHHYNAVDIANICGTPVYAAAEGLVIPDEDFGSGVDGWNGGYGSFVLLEHPFGTNVRTRYAHLEKVLVSIGDYVKQGEEIGLMGETGDATGCHVHFEVYGAQNPLAR